MSDSAAADGESTEECMGPSHAQDDTLVIVCDCVEFLLHLRHVRGRFQLISKMSGDLLPVEASVFDEDS